jgi:hypothetical protein
MTSRAFSPPDSTRHFFSIVAGEPAALARMSPYPPGETRPPATGTPCARRPKVHGVLGEVAHLLPPSATVPSSGGVEPVTSFSSVDLPAPLMPMTPALLAAHDEVEPLIDAAVAVALCTFFSRRPRRNAAPAGTERHRLAALGRLHRSIFSSFFTRL